jgi:hypothetical protein
LNNKDSSTSSSNKPEQVSSSTSSEKSKLSNIIPNISQKRLHESDSETEKQNSISSPNRVNSSSNNDKNKNKSVRLNNEQDITSQIINDQRKLEKEVFNLQTYFSDQFAKLTNIVLESSSNPASTSK